MDYFNNTNLDLKADKHYDRKMHRNKSNQIDVKEDYFKLLKSWCDALIDLQITDKKRPELYGGILCPSCARIHGRCADAVYPLLYLADKTKDDNYIEAAKLLFDWSEKNMTRPDGSYINDPDSWWKGITVFISVSLGEALYQYGHLLDEDSREKWSRRLRSAVDFLYTNIDEMDAVINYPVTCSAVMAVAYRLFKEERYAKKAKALADFTLQHVTEDGFLYGEGKPINTITPKKCRPIDIGYNVEESLGALVTYGLILQDQVVLEKTQALMKNHAFFMLPDGAWDNSFGNRNNKWTYWGSRTSDGCQVAFGLLAAENPLFAEVAYRNFKLYERCTHQGLLHGGPMYVAAKEPPCAHHSFCHAKALASILDHSTKKNIEAKLPIESFEGVRYFPSMDLYIVQKGGYRASVSGYDFDYVEEGHATGGALTLLWHEKTGPILAATMTKYQLVEPHNMQTPHYFEGICSSPQIEKVLGKTRYRSINDKTAVLAADISDDKIHITATGKLVDGDQVGDIAYELTYDFSKDGVCISLLTEGEGCLFRLPVISGENEEYQIEPGKVSIWKKEHLKLMIESHCAMKMHCTAEIDDTIPGRLFNPVGGFQALPLVYRLPKGQRVHIRIWLEG